MKICLTIPSFVPHGGIRIIIEWANRLYDCGHEILLYCKCGGDTSYWNINRRIRIVNDVVSVCNCDRLVICSPHDICLEKVACTGPKIFIFMQMLEHLFRANDNKWISLCQKWYSSSFPKIAISQWNIEFIKKYFPNGGPVHYVGNGVNTKDFPVETADKPNQGVILVEGWNALNPTKDSAQIAPRVAQRLKDMGYYVLGYSQTLPKRFKDVPHEFYVKPSLEQLNDLYRRATILIKASHCDARSCSPMEAGTKGTVTARAIEKGDDDLIHMSNCLRCEYDEKQLFEISLKLLKDDNLRTILAKSMIEYIKAYSWEYWIPKIENILIN